MKTVQAHGRKDRFDDDCDWLNLRGHEDEPMPFPEVDRVVFGQNPLAEVICQFNLPTKLRIETEMPVAFQEGIDSQYPHFDQGKTEEAKSGRSIPIYHFISENERWKISLTSEALLVATTEYDHRDSFDEQLKLALNAYRQAYNVERIEGISLYYRDVIDRKDFDADSDSWTELLAPEVLGEFTNPALASAIRQTQRRTRIDLKSVYGILELSHGFYTLENDQVFVLETNFLDDREGTFDEGLQRLDGLRDIAFRVFRWAIRDKLYEKLDPHTALEGQIT